MKKAILAVALGISMIAGLSGCGLANTAGDSASETATGTAVSGSGVASGSGVVSDSAVREETDTGTVVRDSADKKNKQESKVKVNDASAYRYCNDWHLYEKTLFKSAIIQKTLTGKVLQKYSASGRSGGGPASFLQGEEVELCYVNNEELIFSNYDVCEPDELWSIPLSGKNHSPELDKAKLVLEEEEAYICPDDVIYADSRYIVYKVLTGSDTTSVYMEFDRQQNKKVKIDAEGNEYEWISWSEDQLVKQKKVLLSRITGWDTSSMYSFDTKGSSISEGLYVHTIGSGEVTRIEEDYNTEVSYIWWTVEGENVYYTGLARKPSNEIDNSIYVYNCRTAEKHTLLQGEQLENLCREVLPGEEYKRAGFLYVVNNRLYIESGAFIASYPLDGQGTLKYEKKLAQLINAHNSNYYVVKYVKDRCLLQFDTDSGRKANEAIIDYSYNFSSGKLKKVKKGTSEEALWYYEYDLDMSQ